MGQGWSRAAAYVTGWDDRVARGFKAGSSRLFFDGELRWAVGMHSVAIPGGDVEFTHTAGDPGNNDGTIAGSELVEKTPPPPNPTFMATIRHQERPLHSPPDGLYQSSNSSQEVPGDPATWTS